MTAICLDRVEKRYSLYRHGFDRLYEVVTKRKRHEEITALQTTSLQVPENQILGIVGNNGAGKSTLLKLIAGTLPPTTGHIKVKGRVSALLELGGGFHPEMSGRENVYLNGAILGLSNQKIASLYPEIVAFAGIESFMDRPVKTYSSGMFMRLAFSVATCVEPDILVIDEALSVGDGAFARKSFDRIMRFKEAGKTILFCSHSLYQVEAICTQVVWLEQGRICMEGKPAQVIAAYNTFLQGSTEEKCELSSKNAPKTLPPPNFPVPPKGTARIVTVQVEADGKTARHLHIRSGKSDIRITIQFVSDPSLQAPSLALAFTQKDGQMVTSAGSFNDGLQVFRDSQGMGQVELVFPRFALLKGHYGLDVFLLCEQAIHPYDQAIGVVDLEVEQTGLEQGLVSLPRNWVQGVGKGPGRK